MQLRLLTSIVLCSVLGIDAVINQQQNEVGQKPDFNDVFSSLFGLKTTFLGAKRNHVNKKLDRVSGGFGGIGNIGNIFGSLGSSSSEGDAHGSGHSSGAHENGYSYESPPPASYGPPSNNYLPPAPQTTYGQPQQHDGYHYERPAPVSNNYLPPPPQPQHDGYHYEKPAVGFSSGFASGSSHASHGSNSHGSSLGSLNSIGSFGGSQGLGGLKDLTSIGGFGGGHGKGKGKGSGGQGLGGFGGFGNIFSSIGQLPKQAIGAKKNAVNSVFDGKISLLERFAQLSSRGSNSDSYSSASGGSANNESGGPYA